MTFDNGWQWQQIIPTEREPKGTLTLLQKKTDIQRMVCSWVGLGHPQSCKSATRPTWSPHIFHFQPPHVSFSDWWGLGPPLSPKSYTMFFCGGSKSATRPICSWMGLPTPPSSQVIQNLKWIVRGFPWGLQIDFLGAANRRRGPFAANIF